ncbi:hypothetical protein ES705_27300 [subsurface metagenome]
MNLFIRREGYKKWIVSNIERSKILSQFLSQTIIQDCVKI